VLGVAEMITQTFQYFYLHIGMFITILGDMAFAIIIFLIAFQFVKLWKSHRFYDKFQFGLEKWEFSGNWRTERENGGNILIVTNSNTGGIAKACQLWTDYIFEFETKIIQNNSSWIIRARDVFHYVMLQCNPTELCPHFWDDNIWTYDVRIPLPFTIPLNVWFGVRIKVIGIRVVIILIIKGIETEIFNKPLLESKIVPVTIQDGRNITKMLNYSMGSVGFRESDVECSHFRNVRVKKLEHG
jgi:hypothetical protein